MKEDKPIKEKCTLEDTINLTLYRDSDSKVLRDNDNVV